MFVNNFYRFVLCVSMFWATLVSGTSALAAEQFLIDDQPFGFISNPPSLAHPLILTTDNDYCGRFFWPIEIDVDADARLVRVALAEGTVQFDPCGPPGGPGGFPIEGITELGTYRFDFYIQFDGANNEPFDESLYKGSFELDIAESNAVYQPETPQPGSVQSGVGVLRGWACDAQTIAVVFDDDYKNLIQVGYGTSRADTMAVCGDDNNGYGMVFAWGLLGEGSHRMKTFIDGIEVSEVEFEVAGLGQPFVKDLEGVYELEDFPAPGESVTVQWSEAAQNFVIIGHTKP